MLIQAFMSYGSIHFKRSGIPFMFPKQDAVLAWLCLLQQISLLSWLTEQYVCSGRSFQCRPAKIPELACPRRPHSKGAGCGTKMKAGGKQGTALWAAECYRLYFYACLHFFGEPKVHTAHIKWWVYGCLSATVALQSLSKCWKYWSASTQLEPPCSGWGTSGK